MALQLALVFEGAVAECAVVVGPLLDAGAARFRAHDEIFGFEQELEISEFSDRNDPPRKLFLRFLCLAFLGCRGCRVLDPETNVEEGFSRLGSGTLTVEFNRSKRIYILYAFRSKYTARSTEMRQRTEMNDLAHTK